MSNTKETLAQEDVEIRDENAAEFVRELSEAISKVIAESLIKKDGRYRREIEGPSTNPRKMTVRDSNGRVVLFIDLDAVRKLERSYRSDLN